jgi:hypothetical protein
VRAQSDRGPAGLVGTGAVGSIIHQGQSAHGDTATVGGYSDNGGIGAAWVYTRRKGVWTQQGSKLVGTGVVGSAEQGYSVALSGDGDTAIVGGLFDNSGTGAAWVFVQLTKDDCKHGGWLNFIGPPGPFTDQAQCVSYFAKLQ